MLAFCCLDSYAKHGVLYFYTEKNFENNASANAAQFSFYTDSKVYKKEETRNSAKSYGLNYCFIASKSGSYYLPFIESNPYGFEFNYPSFQDKNYVEINKDDVLKVLNKLDNMAAQYTFIDKINFSYRELCDKYKKRNVFDAEIKFINSPKFYTKKILIPFESSRPQTIIIKN